MPRSVPASFRSVGANVSCVLGAHGQRICWAHAPFSGHAFTAASPRLSMITDDFRCFDLMLFGCVLFHESHSNHLEAWNIQYHPVPLQSVPTHPSLPRPILKMDGFSGRHFKYQDMSSRAKQPCSPPKLQSLVKSWFMKTQAPQSPPQAPLPK